MICIGFTTYALVPFAFVTRNFGLFLGILNAILIGMLLGLVLISQAVQVRQDDCGSRRDGACDTFVSVVAQSYMERLVLWLMMWGKEMRLHTVVVKNLAGHSSRNRKTAYMVSIAVAFLIFAGAMFTLQISSIQQTIRMFLGSDIAVLSLGSPEKQLLPQVTFVSALLPPAAVSAVIGDVGNGCMPLSWFLTRRLICQCT
jgi:hypothetical protein